MKIMKLDFTYGTYLPVFYSNNPDYNNMCYQDQRKLYFDDGFSWGDAWTRYMKPLGYEVEEVVVNEEVMQLQWARENGLHNKDIHEIVVEQVKRFKPDILWFDAVDKELLFKIKMAVSDIKIYMAWVGSALYDNEVWSEFDLVLTCAPETLDVMKGWGVNAQHVHHGFDQKILSKLKKIKNQEKELIFIGQILQRSAFHQHREIMLRRLTESSSLTIYSPSYSRSNLTAVDYLKTFCKRTLFSTYNFITQESVKNHFMKELPIFSKVSKWESKPQYREFQFDKTFESFMEEGVYGIDMFQKIRDAKVTLNIHADSSPKYASNMRMFEVPGVGGCLLTDWRENNKELFEPDYEIVVYKSLDECLDKAKWLLQNDAERGKIAEAGAKRVLKEHTFDKRALDFDRFIKQTLSKKVF